MAANKLAVTMEPSRISIAELRSKFQKEDKSPKSTLPRNHNNLINRSPTATPTLHHQPIKPSSKDKIIRCTSTEINALKSQLNKVVVKSVSDIKVSPQIKKKELVVKSVPEIKVSPQVKKKEVILKSVPDVKVSPQVKKKEVVTRASPESKPVQVPNVSLKPNRSHLSALIVEVQQNQSSNVEQKGTTKMTVAAADNKPPPLPPWPSGIKSAKDNVKLKVLPPVNSAGPPPAIPFRPPNVKLKTLPINTPPLPQRNNEKNLSENLGKISASPIPEYTIEQELGGADTPDDMYGDAEVPLTPSARSNSSSCSHNQMGIGSDDIYQDSFNPNQEEVYEDVANSYDNSFRMTEAEIERSKKKQLKEAEKKKREIQKSLERFGLTGNEVEVQVGIVKETTRKKRKGDLQAQAGERISILKISGTPVGKWLVRNYEGQVGYMDLINIEVNADSVRSVMRQSKTASSLQIGYRESMEFYSDGQSEEAIYEEFT